MWIRLGSFPVLPGKASELRRTYNEQAVPQVRACAGNVGCLLLEPPNESEPYVAITIWKDRAAGEAYESSGAAAGVVALVRGYFAGPPSLQAYESATLGGLPGSAAQG
jgi:quinol monooxygenase YgiN